MISLSLFVTIIWAASSEFVSSSIPSWQILTAHAQPFRGARDLTFCLKVPLDSLLVWVSSGGSGQTARMHRLAWTFTARIDDKYQIRLMRPILFLRAVKPEVLLEKSSKMWNFNYKTKKIISMEFWEKEFAVRYHSAYKIIC